MSTRLVRAVLDSAEPKGADRLCLVALAERVNDGHPERGCWPSQDTLARDCGRVDDSTIRRTLKRLERAGFIEVDRRRRSHVYHVQPARLVPHADASTPGAGARYEDPTPGAGARPTPGAGASTPGADAWSHRAPTPAQPEENPKREQETEPEGTRDAREPERSVGLDVENGKATVTAAPHVSDAAARLASRLVAAGERDAADVLGPKVQQLVEAHGAGRVERILSDLEATPADRIVSKPYGWLRSNLERDARGEYGHTTPQGSAQGAAPPTPYRVGRPMPGKAYPSASVETYVSAGMAERRDFRPNPDPDASDAPLVYAPQASAARATPRVRTSCAGRGGDPQPVRTLYQLPPHP